MAYDIRYKVHIGFSDLYKKMTCIEVIDIYDWQLLQSFNTLSRQKLFCHCVINHIQHKFANIFTLSTGNTYVNKCTGNFGFNILYSINGQSRLLVKQIFESKFLTFSGC